MSQRARVEDVLRHLGLEDWDLLDSLREEGLFPDDEISTTEAEELRVAIVLMRDMGVNAAGVEVILHLRSRLLVLQTAAGETLRQLRRERS